MKLSQLMQAAGLDCPCDTEITALTCRSDRVERGTLFAALEGARADGRAFIPQAVERGAAAILCRGDCAAPVPVLAVEEPRKVLGRMAAEFYGRPAQSMTMIAVTGTKGKTTTTHMLREILLAAGHRTGLIGTLGAFSGRERIAEAENTTPEPVTLHRLLRQMVQDGCTHVVLEASSQAMKLHRLEGICFEAGVFLNLSPDHIGPGEHESFEEYRQCKAQLFRQCRRVVANGADPSWSVLASHIPEGTPVCTFGEARCHPGPGLTTVLELPDRAPYRVPLPGAYSGQDALAALRTAELLAVPEEAIRRGLAGTRVPGRCMVYPAQAPYEVVIDYAHNGASFRALFSALRGQGVKRILAVFGAGGDRPPMRRQELARAAEEGADYAVITEDNPRSESAEDICFQIALELRELPHVVIPDRREAIRYALDLAEPGDVVALLGKGHEEYIEAGGVRRPFSEWRVLEEYFGT